MKYSKLELNGKKHVLAFTCRAAEKIEEKCGDIRNIAKMNDGETAGKTLANTMWMLAVLMEAGKRYADKNGIETAEPIGYDELMDDYGLDDIATIKGAIAGAISGGQKTTVDAVPPKNASAAEAAATNG